MTSTLSLDTLCAEPTDGAVRAIVILVHGYASNAQRVFDLATHWREALPGVAFVAPNAPYPAPSGAGLRQWRALPAPPGTAAIDGIRRGAAFIDALIDAELARYGLPADRLAIVGFSQGTMMSLFVAPRRSERLAGVVGFSGNLAGAEVLAEELRTRPPVLLVHGTADTLIPPSATADAQAHLARVGIDAEVHYLDGLTHEIDARGRALGAAFLARVLFDRR